MRILIVDDDPEVAKTLMKSIEYRGAEVKVFDTAMEARKHVEWADAVICDGTFPLEAGKEPSHCWLVVATQAIRYEKPFIVLSGDETVCAQERKAGFTAFCKGSTRIAAVWAALKEAINKSLDKPNV
jgi:DNA-binding NtrC family response regulator